MKKSYQKTIVFLNLRFAEFYSRDLFKTIKKDKTIRIVAILDDQFKDKSIPHITKYLDQIYLLNSKPKDEFLGEFIYKDLQSILLHELNITSDCRIVCSDEFNLLNAGKLRSEFNLKGHTDHDLIVFRDKVKMKDMLKAAGIRVPKHLKLSDQTTFDEIFNYLGLPFVLKPIDSCGSNGVYIINDKDKFQRIITGSILEALEVEEYIDGRLYHVDCLISNNEIKFICANEYTYPNHEIKNGKVLGSIPLEQKCEFSQRLIEFAKKCLTALKSNNIVNHMEVFLTNQNELIFLEISGRPPGGYLNFTHLINFGINLMDEDFCMQSGINTKINIIPANEKAFFAIFPLSPGRIINLFEPSVKSKYEITWYVNTGDRIEESACKNIMSRSAHAIFYNNDLSLLRHDFDILKTHKAIEVA